MSREAGARDRLVRFVIDPAGIVRPDLDEQLPGRGMWLRAERNVVDKAVAGHLFARAARAPAKAEADLAEQVEELLVRRVRDLLGLARRAGQVVVGFEQVRACLRASAAAVLVAAADGAPDGRHKLRRLAPHLPLITGLSRAELGTALGRDEVVHVAVAPGRLAERLLREATRLAGFRPGVIELPESTVRVGSMAVNGSMAAKETTGPT